MNQERLITLNHVNLQDSIESYLTKKNIIIFKQNQLFLWVNPKKEDYILECGSASGKTAIDLALKSNCHVLGIDFDEKAIKFSNKILNEKFPKLKKNIVFKKADLTKIKLSKKINKVVMADFPEHVPDKVLKKMLDNIKNQLPHVQLYIFTPIRTHIFEILQHHHIILKRISGHINLKTEFEIKKFLTSTGWKIVKYKRTPSSLPLFNLIERILGHVPLIGPLFHRKILILAKPRQN